MLEISIILIFITGAILIMMAIVPFLAVGGLSGGETAGLFMLMLTGIIIVVNVFHYGEWVHLKSECEADLPRNQECVIIFEKPEPSAEIQND